MSTPRVISNSGGRTSGLMTLREMAKGLGPDDYVIFCNTGKERPETLDFLHQQETVLGVPIIWLEYCRFNRWKQVSYETASRRGEPFEAVLMRRPWRWQPFLTERTLYANGQIAVPGSLEYQAYHGKVATPEKQVTAMELFDQIVELFDPNEFEVSMQEVGHVEYEWQETQVVNPNPLGLYLPNLVTRFCTQELKIRVMRDFMRSQGYQHWENVVGIRADEPSRHHSGKASTDSRFDVVHPLYHAGIRKPDVLAFWLTQPFDLQLEDHEGNCDFCFLKGKRKMLDLIRRNPDGVQWWADCEAATGATFSKRDSYADLRKRATTQATLDFWPDEMEESLSCACTD